jgi:hypothetical protein
MLFGPFTVIEVYPNRIVEIHDDTNDTFRVNSQ